VLEEVIGEERKMHETLKKYKKDKGTEIDFTDYEKMLIQYHVVRKHTMLICVKDMENLKSQIKLLFSGEENNLTH
jgi:hypothetical protein